jgi:hypothetical protein
MKSVWVITAVAPILCLQGQNQNVQQVTVPCSPTATQQIQEASKNRQNYDIALRKIALEEKRLYLASLQGSRITEEKTRELSEWILRNLKDYPQGKKAKHADEDTRLLIEALASLQKSN